MLLAAHSIVPRFAERNAKVNPLKENFELVLGEDEHPDARLPYRGHTCIHCGEMLSWLRCQEGQGHQDGCVFCHPGRWMPDWEDKPCPHCEDIGSGN